MYPPSARRFALTTMEKKEPTVGQHAPTLTEDDHAGRDLAVERADVTDIEKVERVYR